MKTFYISFLMLCSLIFQSGCKKSDTGGNNSLYQPPRAGSHWIWRSVIRETGKADVEQKVDMHWLARDSAIGGQKGLAIYTATVSAGATNWQSGLYPSHFIYSAGDWKILPLIYGPLDISESKTWLAYPAIDGGHHQLYNLFFNVWQYEDTNPFLCVKAKYAIDDNSVTLASLKWIMQYENEGGGARETVKCTYYDGAPLLAQEVWRKTDLSTGNYEEHEYNLKSFTY